LGWRNHEERKGGAWELAPQRNTGPLLTIVNPKDQEHVRNVILLVVESFNY